MLSFLLRRAAPPAGADEAARACPAPEAVIASFVQSLARLDPCGTARTGPRRRPRVVARKA